MIKKKKEESSQEPTAPFWMVTYGDMVTLLLTFFILLLSFSIIDEIKFEKAAHSLKGALGVLDKYEYSQFLSKDLNGAIKNYRQYNMSVQDQLNK